MAAAACVLCCMLVLVHWLRGAIMLVAVVAALGVQSESFECTLAVSTQPGNAHIKLLDLRRSRVVQLVFGDVCA